MAPPAEGTGEPAVPELVPVTFPISLGQFLKAAHLVSSGGEAKHLIAVGSVRVNQEVEQRRGRKLLAGDVVEAGGSAVRVAAAGSPAPDPGAPS